MAKTLKQHIRSRAGQLGLRGSNIRKKIASQVRAARKGITKSSNMPGVGKTTAAVLKMKYKKYGMHP